MATKKKPDKEFVVVWEFRVKPGKRREFEKIYGPEGEWAELFRRDKEYIRTDLIRDLETTGRYLTIDAWKSPEAYLRFKKRNRRDYDAIDQKCHSLTEDEVKLGEFYRVAGPRQLCPEAASLDVASTWHRLAIEPSVGQLFSRDK